MLCTQLLLGFLLTTNPSDNGFNDLPSRLDTLSLRQVIISPISAKKMAQRFTRLRKLTLSAQVHTIPSFQNCKSLVF